MAKAKTLVGLDVHATKIVAAVLDAETGQLQTFGMSGDTDGAVGFCAGLPRPVRVAYEAGPTGYGLARELAKRGVECVVAAPSKIPRATGDRVKTDRRDAEHLVRLLLAGKLHAVRVPGDEEEALRDLVRAGENVDFSHVRLVRSWLWSAGWVAVRQAVRDAGQTDMRGFDVAPGHCPPARRERPVSDESDDHVVAVTGVGEVLAGVLDDVVGAERGDELDTVAAAHACDLPAKRLGDLHRERAHPSSGAVDQHRHP